MVEQPLICITPSKSRHLSVAQLAVLGALMWKKVPISITNEVLSQAGAQAGNVGEKKEGRNTQPMRKALHCNGAELGVVVVP